MQTHRCMSDDSGPLYLIPRVALLHAFTIMTAIIGALSRGAIRTIAQHRALLAQANDRADYIVCRERRLLRRIITFTSISCFIIACSAWYTNRLSYLWWNEMLARHGAGEVPDYRLTPTRMRTEARLQSVQALNSTLYHYLPRPIASLTGPAFVASQAYVIQSDALRFAAIIAVLNIIVYLATWTQPGEYFVTRYLMHTGLGGQTYTVFTAVFVHKQLYHLAGNLVMLYFLVPALECLSEHEIGRLSWNFTVPRLFSFYTIAGGFGYFLPTMIAHIVARQTVLDLPCDMTAMGPIPFKMHTGYLPCLGASPALNALAILFALSQPNRLSLGFVSFKAWHSVFPSMLVDILMTRVLPVGVLQHMSGTLFGIIYHHFNAECTMAWDLVLTAVGNRFTAYESQPGDAILPDGTALLAYNVVISSTPLRFSK